jgi:hypothetical protein
MFEAEHRSSETGTRELPIEYPGMANGFFTQAGRLRVKLGASFLSADLPPQPYILPGFDGLGISCLRGDG